MQNLYTAHVEQVQSDAGDNGIFPITGGVRQWCALSPGLFTATRRLDLAKFPCTSEAARLYVDFHVNYRNDAIMHFSNVY